MQTVALTPALLAVGAREIPLYGHHPLLLSAPDRVWIVASGEADVVTSQVADGIPVGYREPVFKGGSGTPLFPLHQHLLTDGEGLLVNTSSPVVLYEVSVEYAADLFALFGLSVKDAIENWAHRIARFCGREEIVSGALRFPQDGELSLLAEKRVAVRPGEMVWVRVTQGQLHAFGEAALTLTPNADFIPLGGDIWFDLPAPAAVTASPDLANASTGDLLAGLALLNRVLARRLLQFRRAAQAEERARLAATAAHERQVFEGALQQLANTLRPELKPVQARESSLLAAASIVGDAIGIVIKAPAASEDLARLKDPIEAIARASRVRHRTVILAGRWWEEDCGPLIAYRGAAQAPVALIRDPWVGYQLIEPGVDEPVKVTPEIALSLKPKAVMFYPRLPETVKTAWGIPRFAMKPHGRDLLFVAVISLTLTGIGMLVPQATSLIMDNAIPDANRRMLAELGAALTMAGLGATLFQLAQSILTTRLTTLSDHTCQTVIWDRLLTLRLPFFRRFSSGDLLERAMAVSAINEELSGQVMRTLLTSLTSLLNLGLLFYYNSTLAWMVAGIGVVILIATLAAGTSMHRSFRKLMALQGPFFGFVVELVNSVGKIRVAGAQRRAFARWSARYAEQLTLMLKTQGVEDYIVVLTLLVPLGSSMALFWIGTQMLNADGADRMTVGTFLAFNSAMGTFLSGATSLSTMAIEFMDTMAKAARVKPLLEAKSETGDELKDPGRLQGQIEFKNVEFAYSEDGPKILNGVSFRILPEEFVAFVGPSGCGKSTIIRLLLGFEEPGAGVIAFDDQSTQGLDLTAVRRQFGVVLQAARINSASIFDNIGGGAQITLDDAWKAAEDAGFADDIREMPMEMHTVISEGGANLSGGQRQRLMISRALVRNPRLIIFDEATSALDNKTQATVSAALDRRKVTRVVIAHRLSTIRNADRIFVLSAGSVVESGKFDELVAANGVFASMIARQIA